MSNVAYRIKELSNGLKAALITVDGQEGMTFSEVVRVLGIPQQTITDYCGSKHIQFHRISGENARPLREAGVIPMRGRPPSVVPQSVIERLVREYPNEQTDAIYNELWDAAKAVHAGEMLKAKDIVGGRDLLDPRAVLANIEYVVGAYRQLVIDHEAEKQAHAETKATARIAHDKSTELERATLHQVWEFAHLNREVRALLSRPQQIPPIDLQGLIGVGYRLGYFRPNLGRIISARSHLNASTANPCKGFTNSIRILIEFPHNNIVG